jgi:hypothetical protein
MTRLNKQTNKYLIITIFILLCCIFHEISAQNIQISTQKAKNAQNIKNASDTLKRKVLDKSLQEAPKILKEKTKNKKVKKVANTVQTIDSLRRKGVNATNVINEIPNKLKNTENKKIKKVSSAIDSIKQSKKLRKAQQAMNMLQNGKIGANYRDSIKLGERLYVGGDFGWAFGQTEIFLNISPLLGYKISDKFSVGIGTIFQYWRTQLIFIDRDTGLNYTSKNTTMFYGARVFARASLFKGLFANVEGEMLNSGIFDKEGNTNRRWSPVLWTGFGYNIKISKLASINVIGVYNPIYDKARTPYKSPFDLRLGFQW